MASGIKLSTKEFIERSTKIHGNKYDYSNVFYTNSKSKVAIGCKKHGLFYQEASGHLSGKGCNKCGFDRSSSKSRLSTDIFVEKAKKIHGNEYDYSKSVYTLAKNKILITCKKHGDFQITANKHLSGRKCPRCGDVNRRKSQTRTQEMFLIEAREKHGDRYDYSKSIYVLSHEKMTITCKQHGDFEQTPASHLQGIGCAKCGFDLTAWNKSSYIKVSKKNKKSCVYLIRCFNDSESFYKIGITTTTLSYRFKKSKMPYSYEVIATVTNGAESDWDNEKEMHRVCKDYRYKPMISFGGETECFFRLTQEVKDFFGVEE